jgi:nucleoside-diphosphate-sugar epimerase
MARGTTGLPPLFSGPRIRLLRGDIADPTAVKEAVAGAGAVVNLAHGGGGADFAAIRQAMVGGAEIVAQACLAAGTRRLVHVGSIASLYLGPGAACVTGATPPDPQAGRRADYARAKAECDLMLLRLHAQEKLPLVVLRPGLVVGQGTSPFHSGLGFFNAEQHVIGWNRGRNPLPFVLVEDVAAAILGALLAEDAEGRCYNLVGDVRPSAREYLGWLAEATGRPVRFHPKFPDLLLAEEGAKWLLKQVGRRRSLPPSRRDLLSRGLTASFDCSDAKRDLGWVPEADTLRFRTATFQAGP